MIFFNFFRKHKDEVKIGDTVICIDDRPKTTSLASPPLVYMKSYIVKGIEICKKCKVKAYDVGFKSNDFTRCHCDMFIPGKGIHWCDSRRFAKNISNEMSYKMEQEATKLVEELKKELELI